MGSDTEKTLLSAWSHPLFNELSRPDPAPTNTVVQSDPLPSTVNPVQLVKVEVVMMTEDEQEVEETVIGPTVSPAEQEASSESSAEGGDEGSVTPVMLEVYR